MVENRLESTFAQFLEALNYPNADLLFVPLLVAGPTESEDTAFGLKMMAVDASNDDEELATFSVKPGEASQKRLRATFDLQFAALKTLNYPVYRQLHNSLLSYRYEASLHRNPRELLTTWRELGQQRLALLLIAVDMVDLVLSGDKNPTASAGTQTKTESA